MSIVDTSENKVRAELEAIGFARNAEYIEVLASPKSSLNYTFVAISHPAGLAKCLSPSELRSENLLYKGDLLGKSAQ